MRRGHESRLSSAAVDARDQPSHELADPVGFLVESFEDLTFDLHPNDAVATTGLHGKLADRQLGPPDQLGRGPRSLFRTRQPDGHGYEPGRRRRENRIPSLRIVPPDHPGFRVGIGPQIVQDRIENGHNPVAHRVPSWGRLPPLAQSHRIASSQRGNFHAIVVRLSRHGSRTTPIRSRERRDGSLANDAEEESRRVL